MKTKIMILVLLNSLLLIGCSQSKNANQTPQASTPVYNTNLFSWNGSTCTLIQTGQVINQAYCNSNPFTSNGQGCFDSVSYSYVNNIYCSGTTATAGNTGYVYSNGYCYSTTTGQPVNPAYCSNTSGATTCNGYYIYQYGNGYSQVVQCYGSNCSGRTLIEYSTGRQVTCQ